MKAINWLLVPGMFFFLACAGEETPSDNEDSSDQTTITFDIDDEDLPRVEMKVVSFSIDDKRAEVAVVNRLDEDLIKIEGNFMFRDSEGNPIEDVFGSPKNDRFSESDTPILVAKKSTVNLSIKCKIPDNAAYVDIAEGEVKTASKERIDI